MARLKNRNLRKLSPGRDRKSITNAPIYSSYGRQAFCVVDVNSLPRLWCDPVYTISVLQQFKWHFRVLT